MNKTITIAGGIVAVIIIGVLMYSMGKNDVDGTPENATSTPVVVGTDQNPNPVQPLSASSPLVMTSANTSPADTTVVVAGSVTPNGAFASYWFEYGKTMALGMRTSNQIVGSGYSAISAPGYITGLVKDTTYYFRLVAENEFGRVTGAQYSFATKQGVSAPVGSLPATRTLGASAITNTSAKVQGEVTPNKAATQYWFEYGKTANLGDTSVFASVGDGSAMVPVSLSIANLEQGVTYYFRINAQNQFGTVNGTILNFKTSGQSASSASAPSAVTGNETGITTSRATLRATVNPNGAPTAYWFEYSTDSLLGSVLLKSTTQQSAGIGTSALSVSADITGLTTRTNYYFRIVAQNSLGTVRGDRQTFKTK